MHRKNIGLLTNLFSTYRNVSFSSAANASDWIFLMLFSARDLSGMRTFYISFNSLSCNDSLRKYITLAVFTFTWCKHSSEFWRRVYTQASQAPCASGLGSSYCTTQDHNGGVSLVDLQRRFAMIRCCAKFVLVWHPADDFLRCLQCYNALHVFESDKKNLQ